MFLFGVTSQRTGTGESGGPSYIVRSSDVTIPGTATVGESLTGTYTYEATNGQLEANRPPSIDDCYITGTLTEGQTITFNVTNHRVYNSGSAAPTVFRLYSASNLSQGGETLVYSGTNTTYLLTASEAAKRLRLEADPKQTGGTNLTGETVKSAYTEVVGGTTFNPVNDIDWNGAYINTTLSGFTNTWANSKGGFASMLQDGVRALPVYNGTLGALEFTRASSQILAFSKNVGLSYPFETYIRFRLKSLTGTQYLVGYNNSIYIAITSTGAVNLSGATTAGGLVTTNTWYVLRAYHNGVSSKVELDFNGSEISLTSSTATVGSGTSRLGGSWSGSNFLDGFISDVFIEQDPLITADKNDLATWFGL